MLLYLFLIFLYGMKKQRQDAPRATYVARCFVQVALIGLRLRQRHALARDVLKLEDMWSPPYPEELMRDMPLPPLPTSTCVGTEQRHAVGEPPAIAKWRVAQGVTRLSVNYQRLQDYWQVAVPRANPYHASVLIQVCAFCEGASQKLPSTLVGLTYPLPLDIDQDHPDADEIWREHEADWQAARCQRVYLVCRRCYKANREWEKQESV